jgi:hypothetical protein
MNIMGGVFVTYLNTGCVFAQENIPSNYLFFGVNYLTDDTSTKTFKADLSYSYLTKQNFAYTAGETYWVLAQPDNGPLVKANAQMQEFYFSLFYKMFSDRLVISGKAGTDNYYSGISKECRYALLYETKLSVAAVDEKSLTVTVTASIKRENLTGSIAGMESGVYYINNSIEVNSMVFSLLNITANYSGAFYSDNNNINSFFTYLYVDILKGNPAVSAGYAYSYSDSAVYNWRLTKVKTSNEAGYLYYYYQYSYDPYYTPMKEKVHGVFVLLKLSYDIISAGIKIVYPFYSSGMLIASPSSGYSPVPDYEVPYESKDISPLQLKCSMSVKVGNNCDIIAEYNLSKKTYYRQEIFTVCLNTKF